MWSMALYSGLQRLLCTEPGHVQGCTGSGAVRRLGLTETSCSITWLACLLMRGSQRTCVKDACRIADIAYRQKLTRDYCQSQRTASARPRIAPALVHLV